MTPNEYRQKHNANLANPFDISRVYDYCPNCGQALDWSDN